MLTRFCLVFPDNLDEMAAILRESDRRLIQQVLIMSAIGIPLECYHNIQQSRGC
jgi:hypothetical protein